MLFYKLTAFTSGAKCFLKQNWIDCQNKPSVHKCYLYFTCQTYFSSPNLLPYRALLKKQNSKKQNNKRWMKFVKLTKFLKGAFFFVFLNRCVLVSTTFSGCWQLSDFFGICFGDWGLLPCCLAARCWTELTCSASGSLGILTHTEERATFWVTWLAQASWF